MRRGIAFILAALVAAPALARPAAERLDRGVVAMHAAPGRVFVSWRLLDTDPTDVAFNVYRQETGCEAARLSQTPIVGGTWFEDAVAEPLARGAMYFVRAVVDGREVAEDSRFALPANAPVRQFIEIPMKTPDGYSINDCSAADLEGDGRYELVVHFAGRSHDNSQKGTTDPPILAAYTLDGRELWRIDLGPNIREGAHYTQFQVFDYDGDGRAELICKTADGTRDGVGNAIGDATARHANADGYVLAGKEFLTVFDGRTGAAIDTIDYRPNRGGPDAPNGAPVTSDQLKRLWGDGYGNRVDRFLAATAYLDGERPSAVFCRGYYTRSFLWAVDFDGKKLTERWLFDSESPANRGRNFSGQGFHNLSVADVDGDGRDEIIYGSMTVDDDGRGLYSTGWGHGDALHVGDFDPDRPGLEVFGIQERFDDAGAHLHDARTGEVLFKRASVRAATSGGDKGEGPGRGLIADIDPGHPGAENWTVGAGLRGLFDARGNKISDAQPRSCNFRIYWDGDPLDELLDGNHIDKWNPKTQQTDRLFTADGCASNNGTKSTPCLSADLFGDWREEVVFRTEDNRALRIYSTTIPTPHRVVTLMRDPQYRLSIAWQNTAYNQPPHLGYDLVRALASPTTRIAP